MTAPELVHLVHVMLAAFLLVLATGAVVLWREAIRDASAKQLPASHTIGFIAFLLFMVALLL